MIVDVALRRFPLGFPTHSVARNHVKSSQLRCHALINPGNRRGAVTQQAAPPATNLPKEAESAATLKNEKVSLKFPATGYPDGEGFMEALPKSLRQAVLRNHIETRNFDWKSSLDGLKSASERLRAAESLMWFLRQRIGKRMRHRVVSKGSSDVSNLPMKRLSILLEREQLIGRYVSTLTARGDSADQVSNTPSATLLPVELEQELGDGRYLEDGWLIRAIKNLNPAQQKKLIKKTIEILSAQTRHRTATNFRRPRIVKRMNEAQSIYRQLNFHRIEPLGPVTLARFRNPFTRRSHTSYEKELQETLKWQNREQAEFDKLFEELSFGENLSQTARDELEESCNAISLKLRAVKRYITRLEQENASAEPGPNIVGDMDQDGDDVGTKASLDHIPKALTIPYRVQHHILKDVFDRFKVALFRFGQRLIPDVMQQEGWVDPEGLSIKGFEEIVLEHRKMHEIYQLYGKQWRSLRHIRNAYAHETPDLDITHFEELLDDVKDLAYVIESNDIDALIDRYQLLLTKYKQEYRKFLTTQQKKLQGDLKSIENERDAALGNTSAKKQDQNEQGQRRINDTFNQMRVDLIASYKVQDRNQQIALTRDIVRYSLTSHIRHCLDSGDDAAWAADVTRSLAKDYAGFAKAGPKAELATRTSKVGDLMGGAAR